MLPDNTESNGTERLPYERPAVVEDLPLETYSLACDPQTGGKGSACAAQGGFATS